ncbi:hypothetical protein F5Y15DRAFT_110494 [Xylariaceae sp. FL0016]|nr:hypothetical protein F5Y15DRAFT_110494 [Xylariaceae sp. FL0016]
MTQETETDTVHRIEQIIIDLDLVKRDDTSCASDQIVCPTSQGGGFCPSDYSCGSQGDCSAVTAGRTSVACGMTDYCNCP